MRQLRPEVRGFSLIELMVVVAIISVLAGLSFAAYQQIGAASAPQNAVNDVVSALIRARGRAAERQTDVWVIVYPNFKKSPAAVSGGPGAYFIYEDKALTFNRASGGTAGEVHYQSGAGGNTFNPVTGVMTGVNEGKLVDSEFMDDYAGKNVGFGVRSGGYTLGAGDAPFSGLVVGSGCTFCDAVRGAVVFSPDGSARFVDSAGAITASAGITSTARAKALAIINKEQHRAYVVAISGPTAFITAFGK